MATTFTTTTTSGGISTTSTSTVSPSQRLALLSREQRRAYDQYIEANKAAVSAYADKLKNAYYATRDSNAHDIGFNKIIDAALSGTKFEDYLKSLETKTTETKLADNDAEYKQPIGIGVDDAPLSSLAEPTPMTLLPTAETAPATTSEPTTAEIKQPEKKSSSSMLSTNVPTVQTKLAPTPTSNLPNPPATPTVPTENKSNNTGTANEVLLKKRRGRASTIGLGKRSDNTELSANIVKLLGV